MQLHKTEIQYGALVTAQELILVTSIILCLLLHLLKAEALVLA